MPFISIWVHVVWCTKGRNPILQPDIRYDLHEHIRENAKTKGIHLDFINGHIDHVHCLISLTNKQNIAEVVQLLKGESSHWFNKNKLSKHKLEWGEEYYAVSVCNSILNNVRNYIKNQEIHHGNKTFEEECQDFMREFGFTEALW